MEPKSDDGHRITSKELFTIATKIIVSDIFLTHKMLPFLKHLCDFKKPYVFFF